MSPVFVMHGFALPYWCTLASHDSWYSDSPIYQFHWPPHNIQSYQKELSLTHHSVRNQLNQLTYIGPDSITIVLFGNKTNAKANKETIKEKKSYTCLFFVCFYYKQSIFIIRFDEMKYNELEMTVMLNKALLKCDIRLVFM